MYFSVVTCYILKLLNTPQGVCCQLCFYIIFLTAQIILTDSSCCWSQSTT